MHTIELESFPPENPFWHDSISCGMDLKDATTNPKLKGVYIMSSGMNNEYDFYIVDSHTGERLGIKLNREPIYDLEVPEYGVLIEVKEFQENCKQGSFIDYDGFGHPAKNMNGIIRSARDYIAPSKAQYIHESAEFVLWFNK